MRLRSKLFVPANRPDLMAKAMVSRADAICFDLEDAVPVEGKAAARLGLREFLISRAADRGLSDNKLLLVRVNRSGTEEYSLDMEAVAGLSLFAIALPKVETPEEVMSVAATLAAQGAGAKPTGLLPTIESARGLRMAAQIAFASPRIVGLQVGFADLLESLRISQTDDFARQHIRLQIRLAAAEGGVPSYESAYTDLRDEVGLRAQLSAARSLGFAGTSCIHPCQIAAANEIFSPTSEEVSTARRIVTAADQAATKGIAVFALDGKMIDNPFVGRARQILADAAEL